MRKSEFRSYRCSYSRALVLALTIRGLLVDKQLDTTLMFT